MDNNFVPECGRFETTSRAAPPPMWCTMRRPGGGGTLVAGCARARTVTTVLHIRSACDDASTEMNCNDDHRGGEDEAHRRVLKRD